MCRLTRTIGSALLAAATLVIAPITASAATFHFSFSGGSWSGSGEFTSSSVSSPYLITGIINGSIFDPFVGSAATIISIDNSYFGADNLLSYPTTPYLDLNGISFDTASLAYNVYYAGGYGIQRGNIVQAFSTFTITQVATTPLPAALPIFATGLAGLGLFGWRRKRKAQAAG
jgi:hypothetical protein